MGSVFLQIRMAVLDNDTISVIIPTYNYANFISTALESAVTQTHAPVEIIVVDDGSSDDTECRVREFGGVTYIRKERGGVSSARNLGIEVARGNYLAFLDADDTWERDKLEKQLRMFHDDPEIGMGHCGMREFDGGSGEEDVLVDGESGWIADHLVLYEGSVIIGPGSTIMVRRDALGEIGGFDERLTHAEDWEFCVRVAKKFKIGFIPEPLVSYRVHGTNAHLDVERMELSTLLAWSKTFENGAFAHLRRRSYGNLHRILAGSFYHNRQYAGFIRNAIKSVWYRPSCVVDFVLERAGGGE
jgi:glycosyltransferase involved in cell wall biosynthesis